MNRDIAIEHGELLLFHDIPEQRKSKTARIARPNEVQLSIYTVNIGIRTVPTNPSLMIRVFLYYLNISHSYSTQSLYQRTPPR